MRTRIQSSFLTIGDTLLQLIELGRSDFRGVFLTLLYRLNIGRPSEHAYTPYTTVLSTAITTLNLQYAYAHTTFMPHYRIYPTTIN
jgi:hypothetical protein